jgi:hypothetical protein
MYSSALRISACDVLGGLDHGVAMIDHADADLLVSLDVLEQMQILAVRAGALDRQDIAVELEQCGSARS